MWPDLFLVCLAVGFLLSIVSLMSSGVHVPHLHLHFHAHAGKAMPGHKGGSVFNLFTLAAFLMWFGGSGYLLLRLTPWALLLVLAVAIPFGIAGAWIVFWLLARVILPNDKPLDPLDYEMPGAIGQLTTALRPGGTGEMICAQQGRRIGISVRSETGEPIARGTEVIVTRYEGGIAYVRTWSELLQNEPSSR